MPDFGLSSLGFNRKRLNTLLEEIETEIKTIFGDDFNVSPETPDGQILGVISESNANLWEIAEEAYNAFNPSAATGFTLSNLVQLNGITRLAATYTTVQLSLTGDPGTIIPISSLISSSTTGEIFSTDNEITLDGSGEGIVLATANNSGPVEAPSNDINVIETPISGWSTVTNLLDGTLGANEETDVELRARRQKSVGNNSVGVLDSIYSAVANIDGVEQLVVLENDTNSTDSNGLPAKSFNVIVSGGDDQTIGDTIWLNKPAGILSFGTEDVTVQDTQGTDHIVSFSRPTAIDIYVEVDITIFSDYPTLGDDLIKQAIVDYANGELVSGEGFTLSEDIILTRLYTPINTVPDHQINTLKIDTSYPPIETSNITIGINEIGRFTVDNIEVVHS